MILKDMVNKRNLTSTEQQLAVFIYNNALKVIHMNQNDLAEAAYVSPATISRFCRKMNCQNYGDFKVLLASEIEASGGKVIDNNIPFASDATLKEIADNIYSSCTSSLKNNRDKLNEDVINRIVKEIICKKTIDIYATGTSAACCVPFSENMSRISYMTYIHSNQADHSFYTSLNYDSYKIIVSHSGKLAALVDLSKQMREQNVPYLLITANRFSPMAAGAEEVYYLNTEEELTLAGKIGMFSSHASLLYIMNVIYSAVFVRDYAKNIQKTEKSALHQLKEMENNFQK